MEIAATFVVPSLFQQSPGYRVPTLDEGRRSHEPPWGVQLGPIELLELFLRKPTLADRIVGWMSSNDGRKISLRLIGEKR
jgi:hypothetical protein